MSISLAQNYLKAMDDVYEAASKTDVLEAASRDVKFVNANTVQLFKMDMDGLGNYSRTSGYVGGAVNGSWETLTLSKDRGRSFQVDAMDDEETINQAFGNLAGEFIRTQVVPEVDAYTFSKIAGTSGIQAGTPDALADIYIDAEIDKGIKALNEKGVPEEGRILFLSEAAYAALKGKITRTVQNTELGINKTIEYYDNCRVIHVPQNRFNTAITLSTGGVGDTDGGYTVTAGGYAIHFILLHPSAVKKVTKLNLPRIFSPMENQNADAWKFDFRLYYDVFVLANKKDGIYMLRTDVANT